MIINSKYNDYYDFIKIVEPYTAFQEISMYLGGVLCINEKESIKIEDKYKISGHRFDKWSFRKKGIK